MSSDIHRTIEAVWRIESARLIAVLTRLVRDVGIAEDLASSALVAALEQWTVSGVPDNPGAWLVATAKHQATDHIRRNVRLEHMPGREQSGDAQQSEHDRCALSYEGICNDIRYVHLKLVPSLQVVMASGKCPAA